MLKGSRKRLPLNGVVRHIYSWEMVHVEVVPLNDLWSQFYWNLNYVPAGRRP
jgi:hypothetical protein